MRWGLREDTVGRARIEHEAMGRTHIRSNGVMVVVRLIAPEHEVIAAARNNEAMVAVRERLVIFDREIVREIVWIEAIADVVIERIVPEDHVAGLERIDAAKESFPYRAFLVIGSEEHGAQVLARPREATRWKLFGQAVKPAQEVVRRGREHNTSPFQTSSSRAAGLEPKIDVELTYSEIM